MVYENSQNNVLGIWFNLVLKVKIWSHLVKYIENQSYESVTIIKVVTPFLYSETKKNRKIQLIFYIDNYFKDQNCAMFGL